MKSQNIYWKMRLVHTKYRNQTLNIYKWKDAWMNAKFMKLSIKAEKHEI